MLNKWEVTASKTYIMETQINFQKLLKVSCLFFEQWKYTPQPHKNLTPKIYAIFLVSNDCPAFKYSRYCLN